MSTCEANSRPAYKCLRKLTQAARLRWHSRLCRYDDDYSSDEDFEQRSVARSMAARPTGGPKSPLNPDKVPGGAAAIRFKKFVDAEMKRLAEERLTYLRRIEMTRWVCLVTAGRSY